MTTDDALNEAREHLQHKSRAPWAWIIVFVCLAGLGASNVMLIRANSGLSDQLTEGRTSRDTQFTALNGRIDELNMQLTTAQRQGAVKDARIRQLTDALVKAGQPVPRPTYVLPILAPTPGAPSPAPTRTTRPAPQPTVTVTVTRTASPQPSPSPSRSCLLPILPC
jgi:hypothetical protein